MSPGNRAASQRYHIQHQGVALQRLLVTYLVLLHSPDTCSSCSSMLVNKRNFSLCSSSSWSCSDAMQMRVLAAAPRSLQDLLLKKTLPSHSLFSFILPLPAFSRLRPGSLSPGDALDPRHEKTARSLCVLGVYSSLQKRHQLRTARVDAAFCEAIFL
jgi:hypothetical protein